ncbi:MAG: arylsulfatase [Betaproteobacteria bacterium]|nr:arylsulfatase [Betaproteobacteria bacterium]
MDPIAAAFRSDWPAARTAHLLEESLFADFGRDGRLTDAMVERFRVLGRYCVSAGADAILFTCSAFGAAIDAVKRDQTIPVLKPNEALYDDMVARGGRIVLLATFAPTIASMSAEIAAHAKSKGVSLHLDTHLVGGALEALMQGRPDDHHRLIAEAAAKFPGHDAIAFGQFSMAPARDRAAVRAGNPILTTPDSAIRKLKAMMA